MATQRGVAIVTGASSGIGEATAECLAAADYSVVAAARSEQPLRELVERIERAGGRAIAVPTDVSNDDATEALVARTWRPSAASTCW